MIVFQPGNARPDGQPATSADHLAALEAVLAAEGVEACHPLGWGTGAKTVLRHYLRHPDGVESIVLLNPAFRHLGQPAGLDSPCEQQLESMAQLLSARPALAPRLMRLFAGFFAPELGPEAATRPDLPAEVLALADPALDAERRAAAGAGGRGERRA